jgi:hypothetical protein
MNAAISANYLAIRCSNLQTGDLELKKVLWEQFIKQS